MIKPPASCHHHLISSQYSRPKLPLAASIGVISVSCACAAQMQRLSLPSHYIEIDFLESIAHSLPDPRAQLGDAAYDAEYAAGLQMTTDEAVAYALEG